LIKKDRYAMVRFKSFKKSSSAKLGQTLEIELMLNKKIILSLLALSGISGSALAAEVTRASLAQETLMNGIYVVGWAEMDLKRSIETGKEALICYDLARTTMAVATTVLMPLESAKYLGADIQELSKTIIERANALEGFCKGDEKARSWTITQPVVQGDLVGLKSELGEYSELVAKVQKAAVDANPDFHKVQPVIQRK
jgi:hypothetical protein